MKAGHSRQLDGLAVPDRRATVPPPRAGAVAKEHTSEGRTVAPRRRRRTATDGGTRPPEPTGKHRRAVTVPTPLVQLLRQRAQQRDRYQTDLILDCLAVTAENLEREHTVASTTEPGPFNRPPRRAFRGRTVTTLTLYLSRDEVQAMDALARRLGRTRSGLVAVALERGLDASP